MAEYLNFSSNYKEINSLSGSNHEQEITIGTKGSILKTKHEFNIKIEDASFSKVLKLDLIDTATLDDKNLKLTITFLNCDFSDKSEDEEKDSDIISSASSLFPSSVKLNLFFVNCVFNQLVLNELYCDKCIFSNCLFLDKLGLNISSDNVCKSVYLLRSDLDFFGSKTRVA